MSNQASVQDEFLQTLVDEKAPVSVFLKNGLRLIGSVQLFDRYIVILASSLGRQAIYKHAIATVMPDTTERTLRSPHSTVRTEANREVEFRVLSRGRMHG